MLHPDQKPLRLASVKGMNDILPEQAALWAHFEDAAQTTLRAYGYQRIRTPDCRAYIAFCAQHWRGDRYRRKRDVLFYRCAQWRELSLRPENTAAIVRA